jgi:hypothetical protein
LSEFHLSVCNVVCLFYCYFFQFFVIDNLGAGEIADDVWENSHWLLTVTPPFEEFTGPISEFKIPTNNNNNTNITNSNNNSSTITNPTATPSSNQVVSPSQPLAITSPTTNYTASLLPALVDTTGPLSPRAQTTAELLFQQSTSPTSNISANPLDLNFATSPNQSMSHNHSLLNLPASLSPRPVSDAFFFPLSPRSNANNNTTTVMDLLNSPRSDVSASGVLPSTSPSFSLLTPIPPNLSSPRGATSNEIQLF